MYNYQFTDKEMTENLTNLEISPHTGSRGKGSGWNTERSVEQSQCGRDAQRTGDFQAQSLRCQSVAESSVCVGQSGSSQI